MRSVETIGWSVGFGLVAILIVTGNILTLIAFFGYKKLLHMRSSYFLINLAAADLLVGAIAVPMYIILLCYHLDNVTYQSIYTAVDIGSGFASVFTLTAIGLERLYAFCWPLRHRAVFTDVKCLLVIGAVWILAFVVTVLHLLYKYHVIPYDVFFYVVITCLSACLFLMCVSYIGIWIRVKFSFSPARHHSSRSDKKIARMLLTITLAFVVTWLPFHLLNIINFFCKFCFPYSALFSCKLLHYANSFLNPVIYVFQMPDFRIGLGKKLCKDNCAMETPMIEGIPLNNLAETEEVKV